MTRQLSHSRLQDSLNRLSLGLRNFVRWRRRGYQEIPLDEHALRERLQALPQGLEREAALRERYRLHPLRQRASLERYLETLTFLKTLELFSRQSPLFSRQAGEGVRWLDVGARNWSYVEALYRFLETQAEGDFQLHGIEIDGYRLFEDLHSRADYAEAYIKDLPHACYEVGDVMTHAASYEVISCFLPFVFLDPCLDWGLTTRHFQPEAFLRHLVFLLKPGGTLMIVNQGEDEAEAQRQLFAQLQMPNFSVTALGALPASFWPYEIPRYAWRCQKGDAL